MRPFHSLATVCLVLHLSTLPVASPAAPADEYAVKAAYLVNFARFVEWPGGETCPSIRIVVVGRDPFGDLLDDVLEGERIDGRPLVAERWVRMRDVPPCSLLFVAEGERLEKVFERTSGSAVLTVGDREDFARHGGVIELVRDGGRVRFDVDLGAANEAGLNVSSRLLALARTVRDSRTGP